MYKEYGQDLLQELIEKVNIVDYISQYVQLTRHGRDYFGMCPFHDENTASFSVSLDKRMFFCFGCGATSTIIDFIMKYHKLNFPQAVEYLINYTGTDISQFKEEFESIKILRKFNKKNTTKVVHEILPDNIMNKYDNQPIYEWLEEGILPEIMDKYQVRYDSRSNRAVFPIINKEGKIINIKGRSLYEKFKELGIKKYLYYYKLGTNDFLFGLNNNIEFIKEKKEVIVVESEKSVWKLEGWGINNVVALATSHINEYQLRLLLELKCEITIALDKNVIIENIKENCAKLLKFTAINVIYDEQGLLKYKDAPVDRGLTVWNELYNKKIKLGGN